SYKSLFNATDQLSFAFMEQCVRPILGQTALLTDVRIALTCKTSNNDARRFAVVSAKLFQTPSQRLGFFGLINVHKGPSATTIGMLGQFACRRRHIFISTPGIDKVVSRNCIHPCAEVPPLKSTWQRAPNPLPDFLRNIIRVAPRR